MLDASHVVPYFDLAIMKDKQTLFDITTNILNRISEVLDRALTGSSGIQEEASSLSKPILVMQETTERPEGIAAGVLKLVGTEEECSYKCFRPIRLCSNGASVEPLWRRNCLQKNAEILEAVP